VLAALKDCSSSADATIGPDRFSPTSGYLQDSMKSPSDPKDFSERRLERASKHVATLWFPINPQVLTTMREKFVKGAYDHSPGLLLEDLKKDFALFTFLVKELIPIATAERVANTIVHNPAELLRWAGPSRIGSLVMDDSLLPQSHIFHALEPFQAERLRETAIIASTAEILSESHNLDPDTGFCHGVLREIGLNLIAWNYPTLYSRVVRSLAVDRTLDDELSKELGFSPSLLAMRVLRPSDSTNPPDDALGQTWATYEQLCEVGEALARSENPDTYPSAENDWKLASAYLKKTVGEKGIDLIKSRAVEHSKEYQKSLNSLFKSLEEFNPERKIAGHRKRSTARKNKYLPFCSKEVQAALKNLYAEMAEAKAARSVLESLLRTIIPQAGFTGGCIFIVDPGAMALMPRTVFGDVKLRSIQRVALRQTHAILHSSAIVIDSSESNRCDTDLAATALSCAQPVIERLEESLTLSFTGIYGSLGDARKIGVLYLEAPEAVDMNADQLSISTFKAMRQALADALQLD
jgi:hypothetical protein